MTGTLLQLGTVERTQLAAVQLVGIVLTGAVVAGIAAVLYRRRTTRQLPPGMGAFLGLATVTGWLLADVLTGAALVEGLAVDHYGSGIYAVLAASLGAAVGIGGRHLGDRVACQVYEIERITGDEDAADLLRSARLQVAVELPDVVGDAEGYGPASAATKRALTGTRLRFPAGLSQSELTERIESRIVADFDVDHAAVTLAGDEVTSLSVGTRRRGLGPTLPPDTVAVGITADPAGDLSPGDPVEVWRAGREGNRFAARGRFRATTGDLATVVVEREDATVFDPLERYRLLTPPATPSDHHHLVALIRSVDETAVALQVRAGDDHEGEFVGWLPGAVLAIERDDEVLALPDDRVTLAAGDTVYLVGNPSALADLEVLAGADGTPEESATASDAATAVPGDN